MKVINFSPKRVAFTLQFLEKINNLQIIELKKMYCEDHQPSQKQEQNLSFMIHLNLLRRYDEKFNFCLGKCTNVLIYSQPHSPLNIQYRDISAYSQEQQYMRRQYRYLTPSGKYQIIDRLRMLKDFYGEVLVMKYEYPMMVLTNNQHTFKRRLRRKKRNVAADASSDDESQDWSLNQSFSTHGFLRLEDTRKYREGHYEADMQMSFDSSVHDIYHSDEEEMPHFRPKLEVEKETDLNHLICDVKDVDYEKTMAAYQIMQEKSTIHKIYDHSDLNKLLKKQQTKQGTSIFPKPSKPRLAEGSFHPRELRSKTNTGRNQKVVGSSYLSNKDGLKQKKQKIRDKAAALLNRVKSHNYIDYSKYLSEKTSIEPQAQTNIQ